MRRTLDIRRSILARVLTVTLAPAILLVAGVSSYIYWKSKNGLEQEMGRRLEGLAMTAAGQKDTKAIVQRRVIDSEDRRYKVVLRNLQELREANDVSRIFIIDFDQTILFDTLETTRLGQDKMYEVAGHRRAFNEVKERRPAHIPMFQTRDGVWHMTGYAPIEVELEEGLAVTAMCGVVADVRFFDQLHSIRLNLFLLSLLGTIGLAVAGVLLSRRLTKPIRRLAVSAKRFGEGDYETPIAEKTGDEIELLAATLDGMRQNIVGRDRMLQMMQRGIAHEVRNPLGGMELYCDILTDELGGRPDLVLHVEKIRRELKSLGKVVNEFMDFTKAQVPDPRRVQVHEYFIELLMPYADLCEKQGVKLVKRVDEQLETAVFDPDLLKRALHNLILNAVQAMADGGVLTIKVVAEDHVLEIVVEDTGRGIAARDLDAVFTPFYTSKEKGTGLGLPFAKKIIESHGGRLAMTSEPGRGTTVTIRLPQSKYEEER